MYSFEHAQATVRKCPGINLSCQSHLPRSILPLRRATSNSFVNTPCMTQKAKFSISISYIHHSHALAFELKAESGISRTLSPIVVIPMGNLRFQQKFLHLL